MLAGDAPDRYYTIPGRELEKRNLASSGTEEDVASLRMTDEWLDLGLEMEMTPPASLWRYPVETVSNSDSGFERVYQGSSLTAVWPLSLKDGGSFTPRIRLTLQRAAGEKGDG